MILGSSKFDLLEKVSDFTNTSSGVIDTFLPRESQTAYVSQLLYVLTLYISKTAALQFLMLLTRPSWAGSPDLRRIVVKVTTMFVVTWLVIVVLCILFQCAVPDPWDQASGRCFDQVRTHALTMPYHENDEDQLAFWMSNGVIDVTTQLLTGLAPLYLLSNLHLPIAKKRLALLSFTPNLTYQIPPDLHDHVLT